MTPKTLYEVLLGTDGSQAVVVASTPKLTLTRSQLRGCIVHTAAKLQAAGIRPGDVVSLAFTNTVCIMSHICFTKKSLSNQIFI